MGRAFHPPRKRARPGPAPENQRRATLFGIWMILTGAIWAAAAIGRALTVREPARGLALDISLALAIALVLSTAILLGYALFRRRAA